MSSAAATFTMRADAPEFVPTQSVGANMGSCGATPVFTPSAACLAAIESATAGGAAAISEASAAATERVKPIIISLDREVRLFPMREPRIKSLEDNVLTWIGMRTEGPTESWITYGVDGGEESHYNGKKTSPFACDQSTKDEYGEDSKLYTMACHNNDYRLASCLRSMPGHPDPTPEQLGDFPKNIQDYYWISDGKNDEYPWRALCRLSTGLFVYITASCAFSGFDCQGNIHVYGAAHPQTLIEHGMAEDARQRFARIFNGPKKPAAAAGGGGGSSASPFRGPGGQKKPWTARPPAPRSAAAPSSGGAGGKK